ncbi:nuclease-related domain-containing protein [Planococcus sp. CAU13]|uniref:nuclease-related domain-containing protein n=1 Tax=Planococcus sp. CAU13 TaxID=1541197 RepID=UPI0005300528|nr:nuclease-related domain-containing protein [Planococcus sp. CAU13]
MIKEKIELLPAAQAIMHFISRLPENHPQRPYLENQLHRKTAGERGEERMQKKFIEFRPDCKFTVLWNIGLKMEGWITQFDGIVITEKGIIILDSKNVSDDLHFNNETDEFIRLNSKGERLILENPVYQLNKNILFLTEWFEERNLPLPVKGLIIYTSANCMFQSKPTGAPVCKTYQMNGYLYEILRSFPSDTAPLNINKIRKLIEKNHTPYRRKPLCQTYFINSAELRRGVLCPECKDYLMVRDKRSWICHDCQYKDATAHHLALQEYLTFIDTSITNKDFRSFCLLDSPAAARRILVQYDFFISGDHKSRQYRIKE